MNQYFVIFIAQCAALHYKNSLILIHISHHLNLIPYYFLIPKNTQRYTKPTIYTISESFMMIFRFRLILGFKLLLQKARMGFNLNSPECNSGLVVQQQYNHEVVEHQYFTIQSSTTSWLLNVILIEPELHSGLFKFNAFSVIFCNNLKPNMSHFYNPMRCIAL